MIEANIGLVDDVAGRWPGQRLNVLTRIGDDHAKLLRAPDSFASLHPELEGAVGPLWHKATGVAPGSTVVIGPQSRAIAPLARSLALEAGAREVIAVADRCTASQAVTALDASRAKLALDGAAIPIALAALGHYQLENARTAAVACTVAAGLGVLPPVEAEPLEQGLGRVIVPGRLELVDRAPPTLLNVTEGPSKARGLLRAAREIGVRRLVVCASAVSRVDRVEEIASALAGASETVTFIATAHNDDDVPAADLARWAAGGGGRDVRCEPDARRAVALARSLATSDRVVLLVGNGIAHALERS